MRLLNLQLLGSIDRPRVAGEDEPKMEAKSSLSSQEERALKSSGMAA